MTPYDLAEKPRRQNPFLLPLIWGGSWLLTRRGGLKVEKQGLEGLKPPYLVLSEHHGYSDYYIAPLALFPHRAFYVSDVEGFAAFGRGLYRNLGCLPTRRFTRNTALVKNLETLAKGENIIVVFPEARHSNVGTSSLLPSSTGKLVKHLDIPVVTLKMMGSYLDAPIWDEDRRRNTPLEAKLELALDRDMIAAMDAPEISEFLNERLSYDEYQWQKENRIVVGSQHRAEGLHSVLYRCVYCGTEHRMNSKNAEISCNVCGQVWFMDEYGELRSYADTEDPIAIPTWYESQRAFVCEEIDRGEYLIDIDVTIEALPNHKGFVPLGSGRLVHCEDGFHLEIHENGEHLMFPAQGMSSVHTEYNYRGKGDCLVLSTQECCYYLYASKDFLPLTKIQFATEELYRRFQSDRIRNQDTGVMKAIPDQS